MTFSRFASRAALGALAVALAITGLPANAGPGDEDAESNGRGSRDQQAEAAQPAPQQGRQASFERARQRNEVRQQQSSEDQPPQVERQQWQGRQSQVPQGPSAQAQRQQWQEERQQQRQQNRQQQEQAQTRQWQGRQQNAQRPRLQVREDTEQAQRQSEQARTHQWQDQQTRNRTYADQNRSTTYRAYDRNGYSTQYQNNPQYWSRDGYRSGTRDTRQWDRSWRNNNQYDWQRYRTTNRNVFNLGRYYSPYQNYSYRRFGVGTILQHLFYGNNYWIDDPWRYRLPDVYGPYRWVRYYDDALLVDVYSGQVVDVIYDFFW
ncbi:MAG: RcnB family protein [Croceibacterium sp.]